MRCSVNNTKPCMEHSSKTPFAQSTHITQDCQITKVALLTALHLLPNAVRPLQRQAASRLRLAVYIQT